MAQLSYDFHLENYSNWSFIFRRGLIERTQPSRRVYLRGFPLNNPNNLQDAKNLLDAIAAHGQPAQEVEVSQGDLENKIGNGFAAFSNAEQVESFLKRCAIERMGSDRPHVYLLPLNQASSQVKVLPYYNEDFQIVNTTRQGREFPVSVTGVHLIMTSGELAFIMEIHFGRVCSCYLNMHKEYPAGAAVVVFGEPDSAERAVKSQTIHVVYPHLYETDLIITYLTTH